MDQAIAQISSVVWQLKILNYLLLQLPFVILKLLEVINWTWFHVLIPTVLLAGTGAIVSIILFLFLLFSKSPDEQEQA